MAATLKQAAKGRKKAYDANGKAGRALEVGGRRLPP
jgi:hypothetical protein